MISIRRRLLFWFVGLSLTGWSVTMLAIWYQITDEIEEVYDAHLIQTAGELGDMVPVLLNQSAADTITPHSVPSTLPGLNQLLREFSRPTDNNEYAATLSARIWWHGIPLHLPGTREEPPPKADNTVQMERHDGLDLRRYVHYDPQSQVLVEVTERHNARAKIIHEVAQASMLPLLVLLPPFGLIAWFAVSGGLRPLKSITDGIRKRSPRDLQVLTLQRVPQEVLPLIEALNQLFTRVERTIERERRFTGDASHELRTPLAGLRIQAQLALRTGDEAQRRHALQQLLTGIDRSTHIVRQLLALARLDPSQTSEACHTQALRPLLQEQLEHLRPLAKQKSIELTVVDGEAKACVDRDMLAILLRNLLDNAIRYTPTGGRVQVACSTTPDSPTIEVADSGPGIPMDQRARVLERFHRGEQKQESGCGLGLSIVQRVAEIHQASLELKKSPLGGLLVRIIFPPPIVEKSDYR